MSSFACVRGSDAKQRRDIQATLYLTFRGGIHRPTVPPSLPPFESNTITEAQVRGTKGRSTLSIKSAAWELVCELVRGGHACWGSVVGFGFRETHVERKKDRNL